MTHLWQNQLAMVATHEELKYVAYVLASIQGFTPPHVVAPPINNPTHVYEILARQVWQLNKNWIPTNMRMYHEIIDARYHSIASPAGLEIMDSTVEFREKIALINFTEYEGKVYEVAALNLRSNGTTLPFHRIVRQNCDSYLDRENMIVHHGIRSNHEFGEDWADVKKDLRYFLNENPPRCIITTQPSVKEILSTRQKILVTEILTMPWDERPGLSAFHQALRIKHLRNSVSNLQSCSYQCHDKYEASIANTRQVNGRNDGHFQFLNGYKCAQQEVNELFFQLRSPRLFRMANHVGEVPQTDEE